MERKKRPSSSLSGRRSRVGGYHLPPCSIRRRRGDDTLWVYRVQLERGKQQRWWATFDRWAKGMGEDYLPIGKVSFTAPSLGGVVVCAHSPTYEPAEFCIDEEDGYIYMIKFNQATSVLTMFVQKLVIYEKIKLMRLAGDPVYFSSKPLLLDNMLKCSHFCISDDDADERRFLLALSSCSKDGEYTSRHSDWLCSLSALDAKNKSFECACTMIMNSANPLYTVFDPTPEVSVWQRLGNNVLGIIACDDAAAYSADTRYLSPMKHFLVSFDGKVVNEMFFFLPTNNDGESSEHRLIGVLGKYLLFDIDDGSSVRAIRVLAKCSHFVSASQSITDLPSLYRHLDIDLTPLNVDRFDASERWFDANGKLYISSFCENSLRCHLLEVSLLDNRDLVKQLADSRQCATCAIFEQTKWLRYDGAQRMSSFKVCSICKEKQLHKMWWRFKCHFCSLRCFTDGWKEHKKIHLLF